MSYIFKLKFYVIKSRFKTFEFISLFFSKARILMSKRMILIPNFEPKSEVGQKMKGKRNYQKSISFQKPFLQIFLTRSYLKAGK
jgi:hypothetical protein